ncbi:SAM-dependent methyltransferase [Saccharopolyspora sp. NFXS83]|uniref:SAM-dependent methyltransferase n=1 Tax=Saccharopolyspora sp. NFXS83 TaxID=2993560 RepID=UPI00224B239E|nr:SAM-dependent methyltransferase [Saccharopolyspora sp. NFXS83]MCX2732301.1 SAM-dependent methyltransferase [Saccharopolyspora sp. NFXS83]
MSNKPSWKPVRADLTRPSAARIYNYFLGGSANFAVDREFAHRALEIFPGAREYARLNRLFLQRVVRFYLDQGVRQFLDIGSGIPTAGSVHEIAQRLNPESTVVYVDNEAVAIAHSQLVLERTPRAEIVQGDVRDPEQLLGVPELTRLLDLDRPVGVTMLAMLHFIPDSEDPVALLGRYRELLAPGSYLALSHCTADQLPELDAAGELYRCTSTPATLRTAEQITGMLSGFDVLEPGVVFTPQWRPDSEEDVGPDPERAASYAAVCRKP